MPSRKTFLARRSLASLTAITSAAVALTISAPAFAQAEASTASGSKGSDDSEDIVVTAQHQAQSLQRVPIAITTVQNATIEQLNLRNVDKVAIVTPGLVYDTGFSYTMIYIRGVGDQGPGVGLETPVATYHDGAYLERITGTSFDLMDVASVEVLKGPQGTLYGRNASGGAILVNTANPTDEFGLSGAVEVGKYNHSQIDTTLNVPVSDTFALRFAGRYRVDGGFIRNVATGDKVRGKTTYTIRTKAKWDPTSNLSATLLLEYQNDVGTANATARNDARPPFCPGCVTNPPVYTGFYQLSEDFRRKDHARYYNVNLNVKYDIGAITLKSITAFRDAAAGITADGDNSAAPLVIADSRYSGKTFQQDLQAVSSFDGIFNFLVGVSYLSDDAHQRSFLYGTAFGLPYPPNRVTRPTERSEGRQDHLTKSYSGFAELYIKPVEQLTVTVGGRYTRDTRRLDSHINARGVAINNPGGPLEFLQHANYEKFTPRFVVAYDADTVNVYASFTRGFRAGGFNTPSYGPLVLPILPETMDSYEVGAKYVSPDRRTRANLALFRYDYKDVLVSIVGPNGATRIVTNAASVRGKGAELDVNHRAAEWLTLSGGVAYLDASYSSYPNAAQFVYRNDAAGNITGLRVGIVDLSGTRVPRAPKWTAFASANIEAPISDGWTGRLNIAGRYTSKYLFIAGASGVLKADFQRSLLLANMSGGIGPNDGSYELGFYVDNLTNKKYYAHRQTGTLGIASLLAMPRAYGLRLKFKLD